MEYNAPEGYFVWRLGCEILESAPLCRGRGIAGAVGLVVGPVWFVVAYGTSGENSSPADRFLRTEGSPWAGKVTIDFNDSYSTPCAYNPHTTCPMPQENRLDVRIEAGEKDYHDTHS